MAQRIMLKRMKILKVESDGRQLCLTFHARTTVNPDLLIRLISTEPGRYQFTPDHRLLVRLPPGAQQGDTLDCLDETIAILSSH